MKEVVLPVLREPEYEEYMFKCPGCRCGHWFRIKAPGGPIWTWNGDRVKPTVNPSILVSWGDPDNPGQDVKRCHSFVRDGLIQFLGDCTHDLKGQTVPLEPFDD